MFNNVEHLFMCKLSIYISSLVKCLFTSFAQFLIESFCFSLSFESSLYMVDTNPLSNMLFTKIFYHFVAFLLIPLTGSFTDFKFLFSMKSSLSFFSFMGLYFGVKS